MKINNYKTSYRQQEQRLIKLFMKRKIKSYMKSHLEHNWRETLNIDLCACVATSIPSQTFYFEMGSHQDAQVGLKLMSL